MSKKPTGKAGRTTPTPPKSTSEIGRSAAAAAEVKPGQKIKVRALQLGYYGEKRRREGDVFVYTLGPKEAKLPKWVEPVDPRTPSRITTGVEELRKKHDEIIRERNPQHGTPLAQDEPDDNPLDA
jgi:hypothetical protein